MTQSTVGHADLGNGKLYYEMGGEGETLILCHAGFVDSGMWDDQWNDFTQHYRVIRFDMRGYGKSDPVTEPISRRDDLYRLLKQIGVQHTYLLGCSMGGQIVIDFALEHPEMVSGLIVISTTPGGFALQGEPPPKLIEMIAAVQQGDLVRASELQLQIWVDGPFRQPEQVNPLVRQHAAEMNRIVVANGTWAKADAQPLNPLEPPAVERLSELHVPTLIMVGALDHPEILRAANMMTSHIDGGEQIIIPETAHVPNMEQPIEFNQSVLNFLHGLMTG